MDIPERLWVAVRPLRAAFSGEPVETESVFLVNEGGWEIHARVARRPVEGRRPGVLVVPGLSTPARALERWQQPVNIGEIARLGCVAMAVDLSGRGRSWGTEVYGGPEHHGDVRAALIELAARPDVDASRIGIVTLSLGIGAAVGALASGHHPPVQFVIDWEGPSDREIITSGGRRMAPAAGHSLDDDRYWYPREAVRHVGRIGVPYIRYQSIRDHAQPGELRHAERMLRAAAAGDLPWFQINEHGRRVVPAAIRWMPEGLRPARRFLHDHLRELCRLA